MSLNNDRKSHGTVLMFTVEIILTQAHNFCQCIFSLPPPIIMTNSLTQVGNIFIFPVTGRKVLSHRDVYFLGCQVVLKRLQ